MVFRRLNMSRVASNAYQGNPGRMAAGVLMASLFATVAAGASGAGVSPTPGKVVAWGHNGFPQAQVPADLNNVIAIAGGLTHSVAVKSDGTVVAWGGNDFGQATVPPGLTGVVAVAAAETHSVALKSDGTVVVWGRPFNCSEHTTTPTGLSGIVAITAGGGQTLALKSDGTIVAWGDNCNGESNVPAGLTNVIGIGAGNYHSIALKSDGTLVGWGSIPAPTGISGVVAISVGGENGLGLKNDGTVVAWGPSNAYGEKDVPPGLNGVVAVAAGGWVPKRPESQFSMALKSDGTVVTWGDNTYGQRNLPAGLGAVKAIAAGSLHGLAIVPDSTPPVITSNVTGTVLNNGWYINTANVSWTVTDGESTISSKTGCDASTVSADTTGVTLTCTATSGGGTTSKSETIKRDATNPGVSCAGADALWHGGDVSIACTANDATSGLASAADASFSLSTSVASGTETANAATGSRTVYDNAGNSTGAGPLSGIKVDKKGPAINITSPTAKVYLLNQTVTAGYTCSDGGSGVASCVGTVADGSVLNTATAGVKTFTVNAKDNVNNASTSSVPYSVGYAFSGFGAPVANAPGVNTGVAGRSMPLKWRLSDANGTWISSLSAIAGLTYKATSCTAFTTDPTGASALPSTTGLVYSAPGFQYDWKTSKAGCYTVFLTLNSGQVFPAYFSLN